MNFVCSSPTRDVPTLNDSPGSVFNLIQVLVLMSTANGLAQYSEEDTRRILRQCRKKNRTSCYLCWSRKVKHDRQSPCDTCVKREYPELCSFTVSQEPLSAIESLSTHLLESQHRSHSHRQSSYDNTPKDPLDAVSNNFDTTPRNHFLGINATLFSSRISPNRTVEDGILPILGLENSGSSPYPFPSVLNSASDKSELLPMDRDVFRYEEPNFLVILTSDFLILGNKLAHYDKLLQCYKQQTHIFSPIILNMETFEHEVCSYLDSRAVGKKGAPQGANYLEHLHSDS